MAKGNTHTAFIALPFKVQAFYVDQIPSYEVWKEAASVFLSTGHRGVIPLTLGVANYDHNDTSEQQREKAQKNVMEDLFTVRKFSFNGKELMVFLKSEDSIFSLLLDPKNEPKIISIAAKKERFTT